MFWSEMKQGFTLKMEFNIWKPVYSISCFKMHQFSIGFISLYLLFYKPQYVRMLEISDDYLWRCLFCSFSLNLVFKYFILTSLLSGELDKGYWVSVLPPVPLMTKEVSESPIWFLETVLHEIPPSCFLPPALHPFVVHNFSNVCIGTRGKMGWWSIFLKMKHNIQNKFCLLFRIGPLELSVTSSRDAHCSCTSLSCAVTEPWLI